tara:strand:- start:791 stop:1294 length:504 start_codon:yes stop_codon:yes gene_type:complete
MKNRSNRENRFYKSVKIGDSLKSFNRTFLHKFGKLDYTIYLKWHEIVGEFFEQHSEPLKIVLIPENDNEKELKNYSRILYVNVSPSVAVEFQHYQNIIIKKINSYFGYEAIKSIKIQQKFIQKSNLTKKENKKNIEKEMKTDLPSKIDNDELKKSIFNLGLSIKNQK